MSLCASIDIGSNTLRLLIGYIKDNRIQEVCYKRYITRLGSGLNQTGRLLDKNIEASLSAIRDFFSLISFHQVKRVKAVATSALREASNSDIFIQRVLIETGIAIEVISGVKEAELTLKGILLSLPLTSLPPNQSLFIIDIGGGSTEWILYKKNRKLDMGSIPVGVIKFYDKYIKNDPVSASDISEFNYGIAPYLHTLSKKISHSIDNHTSLIGTAGTFTTIASIDLELNSYSREKIHFHKLSFASLYKMSQKLFKLKLEDRKNVRGLEPDRADLIIPGIQFTIKLMEMFHFKEIIISEYGLLEGVLMEIT